MHDEVIADLLNLLHGWRDAGFQHPINEMKMTETKANSVLSPDAETDGTFQIFGRKLGQSIETSQIVNCLIAGQI
jgi:hypothetical protein